MDKRKKLAEGKTKIIWTRKGYDGVLIESKDDITAGDGARRNVIPDKGIFATTTTVNCFRALRDARVPNHFGGDQIDDRTFEADRLEMIPIEVVIRRIATGSYLKRRRDLKEGTILPYVVEFFYKDDVEHDPLMIHDFASERILYYDPKQPLVSGFIREVPMENPEVTMEKSIVMRQLGVRAFQALEERWARQGVTLVDLKVECGVVADPGDRFGKIVVGDVIDNDSWRIWPGGNRALMRDKQVYRDFDASADPTALAKKLGEIKNDYAWVAEQTGTFWSRGGV